MAGASFMRPAVKTAIENLRLFQFDKAVKRVFFCQGAKKGGHMKGFFSIMLNHQGCHVVVAFWRDVQKTGR